MLALSAKISVADDDAVPLELRPVAEIGARATESKGPKDEPAVTVVGNETASTTKIVVSVDPDVTSHRYVVRGRVKYEGVKGVGYLELLNNFGDKGTYFTKTLSDWGTLKKITGTSDWREFELPFNADPGMKPKELTLNVVLPGKGTVMVTRPTLADQKLSYQWWGGPEAGWYGGIFGSLIGIFGGLIGTLCALGKARTMTMVALYFALGMGVLCLIAGVVAVVMGQPYHVYYPMLLFGLVMVFSLGFNLRGISRHFNEVEMRRMNAADAS